MVVGLGWGWGWATRTLLRYGYPYGYGDGYGYGGYGYGYDSDRSGYDKSSEAPTRSRVAELQRRPRRAGYYRGAVDGILGPQTRRQFELTSARRRCGLTDRQFSRQWE